MTPYSSLAESVAIFPMGEVWYHKGSLRKPCTNLTNKNKEEKSSWCTTRDTEVKKRKKKLGQGTGNQGIISQITLTFYFESLKFEAEGEEKETYSQDDYPVIFR